MSQGRIRFTVLIYALHAVVSLRFWAVVALLVAVALFFGCGSSSSVTAPPAPDYGLCLNQPFIIHHPPALAYEHCYYPSQFFAGQWVNGYLEL